jgi:hypothetical protein
MDWNNGFNDICGNKRKSIGILITFFHSQRLLTFFIWKVFEGKNVVSLMCLKEILQVSPGLDVVTALVKVIYSMDIPINYQRELLTFR